MAVDQSIVFPHTCTIYRMVDEDEFTDGYRKVIYQGMCREEGAKTLRTYKSNGVYAADHAVYIPEYITGVTNDCMIDVTNDNETMTEIQISSSQPVRYGKNVGTTVYLNEVKN